MSAPPRLLRPFVRTRTRLALTVGLVLAALTAALLPLLPWLQGDDPSAPQARKPVDVRPVGTGPRDEAAAAAEARRTGKEVVVDTATTATELTWARPDGQLHTRISALPVRARNAEGKWAAVDNRLRKGEGGVRPVNPVVPVRFSGGSGSEGKRADRSYSRQPLASDSFLAETVLGGHTVTYTWPGPLPEPVLDGPRALYSEVLPGVDLLLVAREEGGVAQLLIVKDRAAAASVATVSYGLKSPTATFRYDGTAGRVLVLDAARREVGSIPTPFAWDSGGRDPELPAGEAPRTSVATPADVLKLSGLSGIEPGARQAPTPVRLAGDGTRAATLSLSVAETGLLDDPAVRFPVFVDPPLNSGWLAWTVAYKPYPNSSFWNGTNFSSGTSDARVGRENDTNGTARSFWRMNYSSKLKGASVTKATFTILNNHSWSCTKREFQFWLTGAISSGTTWNKQPSWADEIQRKSFAHGWSSGGCPDDYEEFDVRSAAQTGADKGWSNITFGMRATSEGDTQTWRKFKATSAEMNVTYNRDPAVPSSVSSVPGGTCTTAAAGRTVGKANVVLSAKSSDPDGNLSALRFRFWKKDAAVPAGTLVTATSAGKASLTIPSSSLVDKGVYYWNVRAEDSGDGRSAYYPASGNCTLVVDGSAPPPPAVESDVFLEATDDGATWATVKFGKPGPVTFTSSGAAKFRYAIDGLNWEDAPTPTAGVSEVKDLTPKHAGPNTINVIAYDAAGNASKTSNYTFYLPPRDTGDGPGDMTGDGLPDILAVDANGKLINCVGDQGGELSGCLDASYTSAGVLNPAGHWYDASTGKAALITHYADAYPGDGVTDLFAVTPDGTFWLYPGDGYGSFDVDKRMKVFLPSGVPAPSTWTQLKAVGDITGDKLPDVALRSGPSYWVLSGYTGGKFHTATQMNADAWARRDIVNIADINDDDVPDLLWRNLDNGNMYVRHGKPGSVAGSVNLNSLRTAADSLNGDVAYGTNWTETNVSTALGIPDVNKDGIPDIWARFGGDGQIRLYNPSRTNTNAPVKVVQPADWRTVKSLG